MEKNNFQIINFLFLIFGVLFLLNSEVNITGAFIGIPNLIINPNIGIILILIILFISGNLERRIRSKKELPDLNVKQRTFRRKLINLFDLQKRIDPKKIAYLLPQYKKVRATDEHISGHNYKVFIGRRGNLEEYFNVDTRERAEVKINGRSLLLPTHIDIQEREDRNLYIQRRREKIDWRKIIKESKSDDILDYFWKKKKR